MVRLNFNGEQIKDIKPVIKEQTKIKKQEKKKVEVIKEDEEQVLECTCKVKKSEEPEE